MRFQAYSGLGRVVCALVCLLGTLPLLSQAAGGRNVILMISDGASWGTWYLASYWEYGVLGRQPYDSFPVRLGMTTYPLNQSETPTGDSIPSVGYDPARAFGRRPDPGRERPHPYYFDGYRYLRGGFTDSAAAATALASGIKTYNGAINFDNAGRPVPFITQVAKGLGKATGVVSSVPFTHATPAAFGAQNVRRSHYGELGRQMVGGGALDLIMGAGHPLYDADGATRTPPAFANETGSGGGYLARTTWEALRDGAAGWQLIETKVDFEALAGGTLPLSGRPLIGLARVQDTLQFNRSAALFGDAAANPSGTAFNPAVPSLATMTRGALAYLGRDPDGFFLMVEGGAVDWAAHANDTGRVIEEQLDFNAAVAAAVAWVEARSSWQDTLLIVLTDHGNGLPLGPDSDTVAFEPVRNNGAGRLPGVRWHTGNHTNEVTLFRAKGADAERFAALPTGTDPWLPSVPGFDAGRYIDNTAVFGVAKDSLAPPAAK